MVIKIKKVFKSCSCYSTYTFSKIEVTLFIENYCQISLVMLSVKTEHIVHGYFSWKVYICFSMQSSKLLEYQVINKCAAVIFFMSVNTNKANS
jgi:hypothetical protein